MAEKKQGVDASDKPKKMGRRPKQTLAQKIEAAQARDVVARLDDDTLVGTEMAALYLYMSERQLEDLRASGDGPLIEKTIQKGAGRQNQPVRYSMGELRRWRRARTASSTFDAAVTAGLAGWVSQRRPFFAEHDEAFNAARRDVLIADAWDAADEEREKRFASLVRGELRVVWMTAMEAASSLWASVGSHRAHADQALALLREESSAIEGAVFRGELLGETAGAAVPSRRRTVGDRPDGAGAAADAVGES